jgi:phage shock protein PspC (stress-responsive transcriptional regulator)
MKLFEVVRKSNALTYVFCPECGNSYSMKPPADISVEIQDDRLYKYEYGKVLKGVCKGISVLTEIPLLWIRIMSVIYGIAAVATIENVLSDLLTTFLFYIGWFDLETLTSNLYKYIWPIWWYIVALVIVVGCYFLFSAMLKTKQREEVQ